MNKLLRKLLLLFLMTLFTGCNQEKNSCFFEVCVGDRHTTWTLFLNGFKASSPNYKYAKVKTFVHKNDEIDLDVSMERVSSKTDAWRWLGDSFGYYLVGMSVWRVSIISKDKRGFPIEYLNEISNIDDETIENIKKINVGREELLNTNTGNRAIIKLSYDEKKQKRVKYIHINTVSGGELRVFDVDREGWMDVQ